MATETSAPTLTLLPKYANAEVLKPGSRKGKGGNPHHYLVDGVKHSRVTTILNDTIPKPGLVPWARNVALDKFEASLLEYAVAGGNVTPEFAATVKELARNRPDEIKDEAADWGTRAHQAVQETIEFWLTNGTTYAPSEDMFQTIGAFKDFSASLGVQWVATEMTVWDNDLLVAGTVDAIGYGKNGWVIADWKTGKSFYPEMALQLSAYAAMFERITGESVAEAYVVRFPQEQPEPMALCPECTLLGSASSHYPDCQPIPSFEVRKVANLSRSWDRYQELVAQRQYTSAGVWADG